MGLLFEGSDVSPVNVKAGGLSSRFSDKGGLSVRSGRGRRNLVNRLSGASLGQANLIAGLRGRVAPGVSDLRAARLQEIENARSRSVGNLRDNLARRRVLGSSFGEDALARRELEFGQAADKVAAESFLQELDLTNKLINQEFDLRRNSFNTKLNELNLQADFATGLSAQASQVLQTSALLKSRLAEGAGNLFGLAGGTIGTAVGGPIGGAIGSTLGGLAASALT